MTRKTSMFLFTIRPNIVVRLSGDEHYDHTAMMLLSDTMVGKHLLVYQKVLPAAGIENIQKL